jgi:hypothetical protein
MARRIRFSAALLVLCIASGVAQAQVTRTWVSGVGDDANPCSRTAPCKTFAGAISKTATGGEIDALDPGSFGAVTITKSIVIDGGAGIAGVLFAGTNGMNINITVNASTSVVTLRNLDFEGGGLGLTGINFISGGALHVENVSIRNSDPANASAMGIDFHPTANATKLFVSRVSIQKMQGGIKLDPSASGAVVATIDNSLLNGNATFGMRVEGNSSVVATNVTSDGNLNGFYLTDSTNQAPVLSLESCVASHNGTAGVRAGFSGVGLAKVLLSNTQVFKNLNGLQRDGNGEIDTYQNNKVFGNGTDGTPSGPIPQS